MPEGELRLGDENPLAAKIREVMGVGPYDKVTVVTPQFERTDGKEITFFPKGSEQFDKLKANAPDWVLKDIGLCKWEKRKDGLVLWLFPGEWYKHIPEDYEIVDICGETEKFKPGETDDDIRGGCLAYGWLRKEGMT